MKGQGQTIHWYWVINSNSTQEIVLRAGLKKFIMKNNGIENGPKSKPTKDKKFRSELKSNFLNY